MGLRHPVLGVLTSTEKVDVCVREREFVCVLVCVCVCMRHVAEFIFHLAVTHTFVHVYLHIHQMYLKTQATPR